jgi:anti-sigma regulatory factor (Ser/Thr protein kinase)
MRRRSHRGAWIHSGHARSMPVLADESERREKDFRAQTWLSVHFRCMLERSSGPDRCRRRFHSSVEGRVVAGPGYPGGGVLPARSSLRPGRSPATGRMSITLPPATSSCGVARTAIRSFCKQQSLDTLLDDAELLTAEVVANAVEHSHRSIRLTATGTSNWLTVSVTDDCSDPLPTPAEPDVDAERGRGLVVVQSLAGDWGSVSHGDGKSVWFELP